MSRKLIENVYGALAAPHWRIPKETAPQMRQYSMEAADIKDHLPTLKDYASRGRSVLELGMRACVSTWAMLAGLPDDGIYVGCDLNYHPLIEAASKAAEDTGIDFYFVKGDDLKQDFAPFFPDGVDFMFIDSWHVYGQVKRELEKFAPLVNKYIGFHDTTTDAFQGESIRMGWDCVKQAEEKGWPLEDVATGLWPAITEFLEEHPEWEQDVRHCYCNGLTVLKRREDVDE